MERWPDDEMFAGYVEGNVEKSEGTNLTDIALIPSVDVCRPEFCNRGA